MMTDVHPCLRCGAPTPNLKYCRASCYQQALAEQHLAKFWIGVKTGPGCWLWNRRLHYRGYGVTVVHHRQQYAHRVAWELTHGPIPPGMVVMHTCDNPPCVRPDHLRLGTSADNSADMALKGRAAAKLTLAAVADIRASYPGESLGSIAKRHGVSKSQVHRVVKGTHWKAA